MVAIRVKILLYWGGHALAHSGMALTIFYSWQNDSPTKLNRSFIENAINRAIKALSADLEVINALRDQSLALDKDTSGLPGTPPIVEAIFKKIKDCAIFIPDVTFVGKTPKGRPVPNPNVLIEYGYAIHAVSLERIIPVMNTAFGEPSETSLPFNMRHLRWPLQYRLADDTKEEERARVREDLVGEIKNAIKLIIESGAGVGGGTVAGAFAPIAPTGPSSVFWQEGEALDSTYRDRARLEFKVPEGAKMFLRFLPRRATKTLTQTAALNIIQGKLDPLRSRHIAGGVFWSRNKYGAISYSLKANNIICLTELHKNQELWGVNAEPEDWAVPNAGFRVLAPGVFEEVFVASLANYIGLAQNVLGLVPLFRYIAGFTGVKGYRMAAPEGIHFGGFQRYAGEVVEPDIIFEGTIDRIDQDATDILRPFFEAVWDACGLRRPEELDDRLRR